MPPKERFFAYLNYYGPTLIGVLVILVLLSWFLKDVIDKNRDPIAYQFNILDTTDASKTEDLKKEIASVLDLSGSAVSLDASLSLTSDDDPEFVLAAIEKLYVMAAAGDLDALAVREEYVEALCQGGLTDDLRQFGLEEEYLLFYENDDGERIAGGYRLNDQLTERFGLPEKPVFIIAKNSRHSKDSLKILGLLLGD